MANETHSLKIGSSSTTYPIYSNGVFLKSTSTDSSYPLVLSNGVGSSSGTNRKLYTPELFKLFYKLGNITPPDNGYIKSTGFGNILPASNTTASQNCSMLINGYTNADGKLSAVSLWSGTIAAGKGIFLESTVFKFSISYAFSIEQGPMEYKIGTTSKANCYACIYIIDTSGNTLAISYINLANTYKHPNINASTTDPGKAQIYTAFENSFTIPELSYANITGTNQAISIYIVPFTTNLNWKNREALIPMSSSDIYPRNYVISDNLTPILPEVGGGIITTGLDENEPMPVAATNLVGTITNETQIYQNLVVKWELTKTSTSGTTSVMLNNNTIIKNSYGSGLGTSLVGANNIAFAKNGIWVGNNTEALHNIANLNNTGLTLWGQKGGLRIKSDTDYPGLEVIPELNILQEIPVLNIVPAQNGDVAIVGPENFQFRNAVNLKYSLGTSTYKWKEINGIDIKKNGTTVSTSDERYKDFIDDIRIDFDELKYIPKKLFTWKEGYFYDGKKIHFGTSAQKLKEIYPEIVYIYNTTECNDIDSENAILGVDYEKLSLIALAAIDKLHDDITYIENELNSIKEQHQINYIKLNDIKDKLDV